MRGVAVHFLLTAAVLGTLITAHADEKSPRDNIGHTHHHHRHNPPHKTVDDPSRFHTSRTGLRLPLPNEEDAFFFVVYGDRTGGPATGVSVLADAVRDTNLLEPDFVITVGDLIQGYNQHPEWMEQMREFRDIMEKLLCPWFPVAGNHDVYWRGPKEKKPAGEHEKAYEMHFGPLWYAFQHKNCWFVALYSDEGNPETGEKSIRNADCQTMSPEQFAWLESILAKAKDADHIFLFLHHPRWLGLAPDNWKNYGDDWARVHDLLVKAGNVTAVFAGHIHRMRYDPRDGIEYVTLATVGGGQSGLVPSVGYLHQFHIVTVRKDQVAMASVPVGELQDVREITGKMKNECVEYAQQKPAIESTVKLDADGGGSGRVVATINNNTSRPIDVTVMPQSADSRWRFYPDHNHGRIPAGKPLSFAFEIERPGDSLDESFRPLDLVLRSEYLTAGYRYEIPERADPIPLDVAINAPPEPTREHVLLLDGQDDHVMLPSTEVAVPDGPLTLECWFKAEKYGRRVGLLAKTENSEFGIFVSDARPEWSVYIGDKYLSVRAPKGIAKTNTWHHIAGVYDGKETRLYIDGQLIKSAQRAGKRRINGLPLMIGADVNGRGDPMSFFNGRIDEVRLSTVARYSGERFRPARRHTADDDTVLLLHMDGAIGPWLHDASPEAQHPRLFNGARVVPAAN